MGGEPRVDLAGRVAEQLRSLRDDMRTRLLAAVRAALRAQGRSLRGKQGRGLALGVETAVEEFIETVVDPGRDAEPSRAVFRALGRTEFLEGHDIDALRATLTVGAREVWSYLVELGGEGVLSPADLYALAAALFGYVDTLAGAAAEGYLDEQRTASQDWVVARRRLITLLVQPEPPGEPALRAAAEAARWQLPQTVAVASVEGTDVDHLVRAAGGGAVGAVIDDAVRLVVPAPDTPGRLGRLRRTVSGRPAALGPTLPLAQARFSYRLSDRALRLRQSGRLAADGLLICDEHLLTLLMAWEPGLADRLAQRELAPLGAAAEASRPALAATLLAWLEHQGQVIPTARALHAHPQTIRYRLRTLRRLFGTDLDDPAARLRLHVALLHRLGGSAGGVRIAEDGVDRHR